KGSAANTNAAEVLECRHPASTAELERPEIHGGRLREEESAARGAADAPPDVAPVDFDVRVVVGGKRCRARGDPFALLREAALQRDRPVKRIQTLPRPC